MSDKTVTGNLEIGFVQGVGFAVAMILVHVLLGKKLGI